MLQAPSSSADPARAWKVLGVSSLAVFAAALDTTIMFLAFPDIRRTFSDVSAAQLSWVINAYTIVFAALLVPSGRLADRLGRKTLFLGGVVLFALSSALAGAAPSPALLIAARVVQAVGAAALFPSSLALVLQEFPRSQRATAVGVWGAVGALAAATGPSLGAFVIDSGSWRWAFYINLPVGAVALTLGLRLFRESRDLETRYRPDILGTLLLMLAVGTLALAIVQSDEWGWGGLRTLGAFAASAALFPLFLLRALTHHSPALDLTLFRNHNFRLANLATASFGIAFAAMLFGLVLFLTGVWGYSIQTAGLLITPGPLTAALVAGPAGRLADRIGHRPVLVPGGLIFAAGHVWMLTHVGLDRDVAGAWLPALVMTGFGVGLSLPALSSSAVHALPPNRFAVGSAVNQTVRQMGAVLGVALVIALLGSRDPATLLNAFDRVFVLMAAGGVLTSVISAAIDTKPGAALEPGGAVETPAVLGEPREEVA